MTPDFLKGYIHGLEVSFDLAPEDIERLIEIARKELPAKLN